MSRIAEVLKNKNKAEKIKRTRRKNELTKIRMQTAFKAKLYDELRHVDALLDDKSIKAIIITIPDNMQAYFSEALYSEDLIGYNIRQVEGKNNEFIVEKKFINL